VLFLTCLGVVVIVRESGFCAYLCDHGSSARERRHAMRGVLADAGSNEGFAPGNDYNVLIVEVTARVSFSNGCTELSHGISSEVIVETA
jgi:hypothetical protein